MNIPEFYRYINIFKPYIYDLFRIEYNSIVDIAGHVGANGETIRIDSFYDYGVQPTAQREGVDYVYSTTESKANHNGITVISSSVTWDGTQATLADFLNGVGETDPSGAGCWVMKFQGYLTAYMAGAVGGGVVDDTVAIQKAYAALASRTYGGVLRLESEHLMTATLEMSTDSVVVVAKGWGTGITRSTDYGDTFYLHGNSTTGVPLRYAGVSNMRITSTAKTTSGAHIHTEGVNRSTFSNVFMVDGFIGWKLNGLTASYIDDIYLIFTNNYTGTATGRRYMEFGNATGAYGHPSCGDLFINGFNIRGTTADQTLTEYGINIISADGIWFSDGHVGNAFQANINIDNAGSTELLNLLFFSNVMSDEGTNYSLYFGGDATNVFREITFDDCHFKGGPGCSYGIATGANTRAYEVNFDGCMVNGFQEEGVYIQAPNFRKVTFDGVLVYGNGRNAGTNAAGYRFAANVKDISIIGGNSGGSTGSAADAGTQSYGVEFTSGHSNIVLDGVDLGTNATGPYNTIPAGVTLVNCNTGSGVISVYDNAARIGLGTTPTTANLITANDITGATTAYGFRQQGEVKSDVTSIGVGYSNVLLTQATAFTLTQYMHFRADQSTIGAGSAVTSQMGFSAAATLIGAANNYGFYGNIPAAANRWNFYAAGTARNLFNGDLTVFGGTAIPAGGAAGTGYMFSSTANFGVFFGSGAPTLSAAKGSLYLRSDGSGVSDRMYVNTDGATTWTAVTTAA
jgi:hypothetical protein